MSTIVFVFLIALMVTGFSTPWIRQLAIYLGFVDAPAQRKLHSTPMPLMGGVAIFVGAGRGDFVTVAKCRFNSVATSAGNFAGMYFYGDSWIGR